MSRHWGEIQREMDAARARRDALRVELESLGDKKELTPGEAQRLERQLTGFDRAEAEFQALRTEYVEAMRAGLADGTMTTESAYVDRTTSPPAARGGDLRGQALRTVDAAVRNRTLPEYAAETVESLVSEGTPAERDIAARWATTAGAEHYRSAFAKLVADPTRGHMLWTPAEQAAYSAVQEVRAAMAITSTHGAEMLPLALDPAIMLTSDGSINPLRQLSRVVRTSSSSWRGVTSAGVSAEWKSEAAQAADASPTLANADIPVFLGDAYVQFSYEVGMDALNFLDELTKLLVDAADQLQATAFTLGNGTTAPQGIVTGLIGGASEINSAASEALSAADAYALQNALPPRFSATASWLAGIATINAFQAFETANGSKVFPEIANGQLLRKPLHELSNLDQTIVPSATANNYVMAYGSWKDAYVIVDRIGSSIELIPNVMGANNRPSGERGVILWFRTGAEVVVPQAARILDVPTTA